MRWNGLDGPNCSRLVAIFQVANGLDPNRVEWIVFASGF